MNTFLPAVLLPEPVAWPQLQRACEQVLGRTLDQSAFIKRMLRSGESRSCRLPVRVLATAPTDTLKAHAT